MSKLETSIKEIARFYFIALKNIQDESISSNEIDVFSPFYKYYADVEEAFSRLDKEKKRLITNEYFYDAYSNWWKKEYRKTRFLLLRKAAIKEFVEAFYEIH